MVKETLPLDESGNGPRLRTLVFDEADAFAMAHAMMIGANTAWLNQAHDARRRLDHYAEQFMEFAPPEAKLLRNDTDLCEIAIAMASSAICTVHRRTERYSSARGRTVITIGKGTWESRDLAEAPEHEAIIGMIERIAPTGCEIVRGEDERSKW